MSETAVPQPELSEEDVNTTPPNPQTVNGKSGWTMPEPVFRKTSGYLPQGFEKRFSDGDLDPPPANDNYSAAEVPAPALDAIIEPQPEIGEPAEDTFGANHAPAAAAAPAKSSGAKVVFIILGLLAAAALIVVLMMAVYFLYQFPSSDGTFQ